MTGGPQRLSTATSDDTAPAGAEHLGSRLAFETLLADLSSRFINLAPADVDRAIEDALREVCELLSLDLGLLWQWSTDSPGLFTLTHAYPVGSARHVSSSVGYPWTTRQMLSGCTVVLSSLNDLPADAAVDRDSARQFGIKSNLTLPLAVGGEPPVGTLAFNTLRAEREWPDTLVKRLQLVAQVFANALARRRDVEALRTNEARLSAAADLARLAFYEVDYEARTMYADDRLRHVCGVPAGIVGFDVLAFWMEHLHPEDRALVLEKRQELHRAAIEELSLEYRYAHPDGRLLWIHHLARIARFDAAGHAVRACGVLRDITERRQREESLRQSYAEIERLKDKLQAESDYLKAEIRTTQARGEFTGQSPAILKIMREVAQVAPADSTVLLRGETGSGKELVAEAIHRLSARRNHVMVKVNCAALPSGLIESELFGREKGAFTGALTRQAGRFEIADGSTLFFDEVGELSLEVQAKLLRVLERGEFERLGSPRTLKVNVRLIAATNRDLSEAIKLGRFREDLFYRLNVFPIQVPPLRERTEDIPLLVWAFLEEFSSRMGKKITQIPRTTMEALQRHAWPGNVRELRNVIEHGAIVSTGETLKVPLLDVVAAVARPQTLADVEREHINRVLQRTAWHVKGPHGAAAELGLNPATLYSRMKKLGIPLRKETAAGSA